ncbi:hypothetical protein Tco_0946208 [Tanacetum coccineum]
MDGVDNENLTIEQYLELTQNNAPSVAKVDVPARYMDHLSPLHKIPDPPLDAKTNPYLQASQSPIHLKITKTSSKYTRENGVNKKREQGDQGLSDWFEAELEKCLKIQQKRDNNHLNLRRHTDSFQL